MNPAPHNVVSGDKLLLERPIFLNCSPPSIEQQASGLAWFSSGGLGNTRKYGARIVNEFIHDRGAGPSKGHRMNIMHPNFHYVGVGVVGGWITMEFAQNYTDKPEAAQTDVWER